MIKRKVLAVLLGGLMLGAVAWPQDAQAWAVFTHGSVCYNDFSTSYLTTTGNTVRGIRYVGGGGPSTASGLVCPVMESTNTPANASHWAFTSANVPSGSYTSRACRARPGGTTCRSTRFSSGTGEVLINHGSGSGGFNDQQIWLGNSYFAYLYVQLGQNVELHGIQTCSTYNCT